MEFFIKFLVSVFFWTWILKPILKVVFKVIYEYSPKFRRLIKGVIVKANKYLKENE